MQFAEARQLLLMHGPGTVGPTGEPLVLENGFLGSLRPYRGLNEQNFHIVMEALLSVGEELHRHSHIDRELVHAMWTICSTARAWGLHPNGMLQRNQLITATDTARLERWVGTLEIVSLRLLHGEPPHHAVYYYAGYILAEGASGNVPFFIELMAQAIADPSSGDAIEDIAQALGKLGSQARSALPALREAELREYSWFHPAERCTADVRSQLRKAIELIENSGE